MRQIDLASLHSVKTCCDGHIFADFLKCNDIHLKPHEIDCIESLIKLLTEHDNFWKVTDSYLLGYRVPQIDKEFDILRIDTSIVVNIEVKLEATVDSVLKQLKRNRYYLTFLNRKIHAFSYDKRNNTLYRLSEDGELLVSHISELVEILIQQTYPFEFDLNALFKPSKFLISPFNATNRFLASEYFLTSWQEQICAESLKHFSQYGFRMVSVRGAAGTGKTLLTYHLARLLKFDRKVTIVHCGILNSGQEHLVQNANWKIKSIKGFECSKIDDDVIVVDEAQRLRSDQFEAILGTLRADGKKCLFSFDDKQTLGRNELGDFMREKIERHATLKFKLSNKVRTNENISNIIECLFDRERTCSPDFDYSSLQFRFVCTIADARSYMHNIDKTYWKIINFTTSQYNSDHLDKFRINSAFDNAHKVIGQEFDHVIAVVDEYFSYNDRGKLIATHHMQKPHYDPVKMLYQIISRARLKIQIVIINSKELLERCIEIHNTKLTAKALDQIKD